MPYEGFIKLPRSFMYDEIYMDQKAKALFLHLILKAYYKDEGKEKREMCRSSYRKLALETGLTVQNIRTAMATLISAHKITQYSTHPSLTISICNYDTYQGIAETFQHDIQHTAQHKEQHKTAERRSPYTPKKEYKETFEEGQENIILPADQEKVSVVVVKPPTQEEVNDYIQEHNYQVNSIRFYEYYSKSGWKTKNGKPINDWKTKVDEWAHRERSYYGNKDNQGNHSAVSAKQSANEYAVASLIDY